MLHLKKHKLMPLKLKSSAHRYRIRQWAAAGSPKGKTSSGQALSEYILIVSVWFPIGVMVAGMFAGMDSIEGYIFDYYAALSDFLALPFF